MIDSNIQRWLDECKADTTESSILSAKNDYNSAWKDGRKIEPLVVVHGDVIGVSKGYLMFKDKFATLIKPRSLVERWAEDDKMSENYSVEVTHTDGTKTLEK